MKKFRTNPLMIIFLTVFVDLLGFGILIPVIPLLLANPGSPYYMLPAGWSVSEGYVLLGILSAMFPLMQFVATPILGQLSDVYGRKKLLAISLAGTCISYILFAIGIITHNIALLFFARALDGITGGNISVAQAAIADVTTPENRAKNFGLIGAAFGLGFIMGPYIGGKLSDPGLVSWFSAATPFWFAAALSFVNVLFVIGKFPETLKIKQAHRRIVWSQSIHNIIAAWNMKSVQPLFITSFFVQGGLSFFFTFFSVYLFRRFGFGQGATGDFFSYIGLWVAFTQMFLTRRVATKFEEYKILRMTVFGMSIAILLYLFPRIWWQIYLIAPFFAMANGLTQANLLGLVSRSAPGDIQGEILGINASVQALAQALPPILSGFLVASTTPETSILVSSAILAAAGVLFVTLYKPAATKTNP